jgi:membrane-associated protease RseP (regulator of RpoE activity)
MFGVAYVAEIMPSNAPVTVTAKEAGAVGFGGAAAAVPSGAVVERVLLAPNVIGVVMDEQGHVLLPVYAPAENMGALPIPVVLCDGTVGTARFVGSDRQTKLTVLQMLRGAVHPLAFSSTPPPEGSLVMLMTMDPGATHLGVWTRWASNLGLVLRTDGTVAGFSARGHFISAAMCAPVARQIIEHGHVQRAHLGVSVEIVPENDPQRVMDAALGQTPAIRIKAVEGNSAAERAGLQSGDLILSLAGRPISFDESFESFSADISGRRGDTELKILRQGRIISVTVDLEPPPDN